MKVLLVFVALTATIFGEPKSYEGYKVYQIIPNTEQKLVFLKTITNHPNDFDFWSPIRGVNSSADVMVSPVAQREFTKLLENENVQYKIKIENVQTSILATSFIQRFLPDLPGQISFNKYHRYKTIQDYLHRLAFDYPELVEVSSIGKTTEGREITMIKISTGGGEKPAILIDAAIHAREWITPSVALYAINQLVENKENYNFIRNIDWYIIPVLNPDGYEYSHTDDRMWRKTRSKGVVCEGVDANRNFDAHWNEIEDLSDECHDIYAGPEAFSEPETRALRDFILAQRSNLKLYLDFHSYGPYILYSWGYTKELPEDIEELHSLANSVNGAMKEYRGTNYVIGPPPYILYNAYGISFDWTKATAGVELSYSIELPGGGDWGFDPPPTDILPIVQETWLGIKKYHEYISQKFV